MEHIESNCTEQSAVSNMDFIKPSRLVSHKTKDKYKVKNKHSHRIMRDSGEIDFTSPIRRLPNLLGSYCETGF